MHGGHLNKSWSTNQSAKALSSGEAEYYSLVTGASMALGIRSIFLDLGVKCDKSIEIKSDASASLGIVNRIVLGNVRHTNVTQLCVQEKVSKGEILVAKARTTENLADALTKAVSKEIMSIIIEGLGGGLRQDRHGTALCRNTARMLPTTGKRIRRRCGSDVDGGGSGKCVASTALPCTACFVQLFHVLYQKPN